MENPCKAVRIVLVRPRNPLNIAAAARAARNFGFEDFAVVAPYGPVWEEARAAAGAKRWLRGAHCFPRLAGAIEDRDWVIGTSCLSRRRSFDPAKVMSLDTLSSYFGKPRVPNPPSTRSGPRAKPRGESRIPLRNRERVALLFGSEKRGLSNEDLSCCHHILRIPTTTQTPSMNLGQAVAVCCYEMRRWLVPHRAPSKATTPYATVGEVTRLVDEMDKLLGGATTLPPGRAGKRKTRLQQMLLRWPLRSQDVALVLGILRDFTWQLQQRPTPAPPLPSL